MAAKIAVAVSGGVDSLGALMILKDAGESVIAMHGRFLPGNTASQTREARLAKVCRKLGVELKIIDLIDAFQSRVITPYETALVKGYTPNPCARCNQQVKFGILAQAAKNLGATKLATGHYARISEYSGYRLLTENAANSKDQTYFLSLLSQNQLQYALFPLTCAHKNHIRQMVKKKGLQAPESAESQDVCFANTDFSDKLFKKYPQIGKPGPVILMDKDTQGKVIGQHRGLGRYTQGQRRGLNMSWKEPLYALAKDHVGNALFVGPRSLLGFTKIGISLASLAVPPESWPGEIFVRLRYRSKKIATKIEFAQKQAQIHLAAPFPTAPGQIAAFYDTTGHIFGAGIILNCA